jgi:sigma-B regulation protein RsbU (phosphoserine phosphatase)
VHKTGSSPASVLSLLNDRLCLRGIPGRHTALQYAVFCPQTAEIRIASAGMPGPLLLRNQQWQTLQIAGIPPGLFPAVRYQLQPGDSLLFCTDGLTDARNASDEEFGLEGLEALCYRHSTAQPLDLLDHIFNNLATFTRNCRQWDDMTAAVFHYFPG